jgi:hypothetical protein
MAKTMTKIAGQLAWLPQALQHILDMHEAIIAPFVQNFSTHTRFT